MAVTLTEFLASVRRGTVRDQALAAMYYAAEYDSVAVFTVEDIRALLVRARMPRAAKVDLSMPLARAGALVDSPGISGGRKLWQLTDSGKGHVRKVLNLPDIVIEPVNDIAALEALISQVADPDIHDYLTEALACLQFGALRASVVFLWVGAVRTLQQEALRHGTTALTIAVRKHDPKARDITTLDHFAYIKESTLLLAIEGIGMMDKNQRQMLEHALDLRNKCGHPGKYNPGPKKVSAFIEDVLKIVFGVT